MDIQDEMDKQDKIFNALHILNENLLYVYDVMESLSKKFDMLNKERQLRKIVKLSVSKSKQPAKKVAFEDYIEDYEEDEDSEEDNEEDNEDVNEEPNNVIIEELPTNVGGFIPKPYECKKCGHRFGYPQTLKHHMVTSCRGNVGGSCRRK